MDVEQLIADTWTRKMRESSARYFLVNVDRVQFGKTNPDVFRVVGTRVDNGEPVVVMSQKSASLQALPEAGGIMRADKASPINDINGITAYDAKYFHAYPATDFCMKATARPEAPQKDAASGQWSAKVNMVDHEVNVLAAKGSNLTKEKITALLLPLLKPWEAQKPSSITHDIRGTSIWEKPVAGLSPYIDLRISGKSTRIFGVGAIKGEGDQLLLPSDEMIVERIQKNKKLNDLLEAVKPVPAERLDEIMFFAYPGISLNVGRDSLKGNGEKYLTLPEQFDYKADGDKTFRGWREHTNIHMKISRTNRMMVVDVVPRGGGSLHKRVPDSTAEHEYIARKLVQRDSASTHAGPQGAAQGTTGTPPQEQTPNQQPDKAASQQRAQAPARQPERAAHAPEPTTTPSASDQFDDLNMDDGSPMPDYDEYASDIGAMEAMNDIQQDFDDDLDDVLAQAEQRQQARTMPRM